MNNKKRRKPQRRQKSSQTRRNRIPSLDDINIIWSRIDPALASFDATSLLTLLSAAVDSPTCGHRLLSLGILWTRTVTHPPKGSKTAHPSDLPTLLAAAKNSFRQLRFLEDYWPPDPRYVVRHAVGNQRFRIHPGMVIDATQVLRVAQTTAQAIDNFILQHYGFTLSDLLEAALRYSDWRLSLLSPHWPSEIEFPNKDEYNQADLEDRITSISSISATLTEKEINAITNANPEIWTSICVNPKRSAAAWNWATTSSQSLYIKLAPMQQSFGPVLAVDSSIGIVVIPAAFIVSSLAAAVVTLAKEAVSDIKSTEQMQLVTENRVFEILGKQPSVSIEHLIQRNLIVIIPGSRHVFIIGIASGLDLNSLKTAISRTDSMLVDLSINKLTSMESSIDSSSSLCRLVLYNSPYLLSGESKTGVVHFHVEEFINYILDVQQTGLGPDFIWQYLDELATYPGVANIVSVDNSDIWRRWSSWGILNPTGATNVTLMVNPNVDDHQWRIAANWEPIEDILTAVGLPPVMSWPSARLNNSVDATLVNSKNEVFLINSDLPLVVSTSIDKELSDLGINPSFLIGIADGILLTCINFPQIHRGIVLANQKPLVITLGFTTKRSPRSNDDYVGIGISASTTPNCAIDLLLGLDWLEMLMSDPSIAHEILGEAFAHGLDQLDKDHEQNNWPNVRELFLSTWKQTPPIAMLHTTETVLPLPYDKGVELPRNKASHARALRRLAQEIIVNKVSIGLFVDSQAEDIYKNKILSVIDSALKSSMKNWAREAILIVSEYLNNEHGKRQRTSAELEYSLVGPWQQSWHRFILNEPEEAEFTRPLELMIEILLSDPPNGIMIPDKFDIAEVCELASIALKWSLAVSGFRSGLNGLSLEIINGGLLNIVPTLSSDMERDSNHQAREDGTHINIDMDSYLKADRSHRFRIGNISDLPDSVKPIKIQPNISRFENTFVPLEKEKIPQTLVKANEKLRKECGTGIEGLMAVLGTAVSWIAGDNRVVKIQQNELRDAAQVWSSLTIAEIDAALDRLTLEGSQLKKEGMIYWEQERRRYRLATRPLIRFDRSLVLIPWRIMATQNVYQNYLSDGRIPWHKDDLPQTVIDAFNEFRQVANKGLERGAAKVAHDLGLPYKENILEKEAAQFGLALPGEVDLLVADPSLSRLWVCEIKDISTAFSPSTIKGRIDKFYSKGYIEKLLARTAVVADNTTAAAKLLSVEPYQKWRVLPLMVTRQVEPIAFNIDIAVTFTTLDNFAAILQDDIDPKFGSYPYISVE